MLLHTLHNLRNECVLWSTTAVQYSPRRERRRCSVAMAVRLAYWPACACVVAHGSVERACWRRAHGRQFGSSVSTPARWRQRPRLEPRTTGVLLALQGATVFGGPPSWPSIPTGAAHRPPPRKTASSQEAVMAQDSKAVSAPQGSATSPSAWKVQYFLCSSVFLWTTLCSSCGSIRCMTACCSEIKHSS
jgi:hypothetical protein